MKKRIFLTAAICAAAMLLAPAAASAKNKKAETEAIETETESQAPIEETESENHASGKESESENQISDDEAESENQTSDDEAASESRTSADKSEKKKQDSSDVKKGKALKKGDCIGIAAPAYFIKNNDFKQSLLFLQKLGYNIKLSESCLTSDRFFAGSDEARARDLNALFEDDSVDAILCLRGGYGCARILDLLDYDMIARHPKLLIGYSDITALHVALQQKCGLATVHGPMVSSFSSVYETYVHRQFEKELDFDDVTGEIDGIAGTDSDDKTGETDEKAKIDKDRENDPLSSLDLASQDALSIVKDLPLEYTVTQLADGLTDSTPIGKIQLPKGHALETLVPGTAEGPIIGGNLTVLVSLLGTDYELKGDHALLFIEEVGESAYRIDRMLQQLYQNGLFDRVDGILIGELTDCTDQEGSTCRQVIEEYAQLAGKPCISGIPAGHGTNNMFLPFGVNAKMTASKGGSASVEILENALE